MSPTANGPRHQPCGLKIDEDYSRPLDIALHVLAWSSDICALLLLSGKYQTSLLCPDRLSISTFCQALFLLGEFIELLFSANFIIKR